MRAYMQSVLMQNERELTQAVFFQGLGDPEVYPRPKGEVYVTGFPGLPLLVPFCASCTI